jgi:hypothetical protein
MEGNIGKNSRTGRPAAVIRFDHIWEINDLRGEKVDRTPIPGSEVSTNCLNGGEPCIVQTAQSIAFAMISLP